MNLLIIDTSGQKGLVFLLRKGGYCEKKEFDARDQQKFLIGAIDTLLKESALTLEDLDQIAVCIGPGSFTGTRIGYMTGKTLAYAKNIPLITYNSLLPYYKPGHLVVHPIKNNACFVFDGAEIKKISILKLENETRPIIHCEGVYAIENIFTLTLLEEHSLIY